MAVSLAGQAGITLLVGRVLFGGVLALMGLNHFMRTEQMTEYAASKGLPAPKLGVLVSGVALVGGGLSVVAGIYPAVGAALLALFLLVATPTFHDFWAVDDPEVKQQEMTNFLKNSALFGAALAFVVLAVGEWPYAAGVGL